MRPGASAYVPPDLHEVVGPGDWSRLPRRGSGALSYRWRGSRGDLFVKAMRRRHDVVDGHDAASLIRRAEQVRLIRREAPALRPFVPGVTVTEARDLVVLTSPFVDGVSPVDLLLADDARAFGRRVRAVLDVVGDRGYGRFSVAAPAGAASALYRDRLRRRLELTVAVLPGWVPTGWTAGREQLRPSPPALLATLDRLARRDDLLPSRLWFPVHGDMNLLNVIVDGRSDRLALVDQRGTCAPWDPVYDLAKMLLSLTIHVGLEYGFLLPRTEGAPPGRSTVDGVGSASTTGLMTAGVRELRSAIEGWEFGRVIEPRSSHLWHRVLFAHAVHALCEAACRISVARTRHAVGRDREMVKAAAYHAYGTRCLDSLVGGNGDVPMPAPGELVRA